MIEDKNVLGQPIMREVQPYDDVETQLNSETQDYNHTVAGVDYALTSNA